MMSKGYKSTLYVRSSWPHSEQEHHRLSGACFPQRQTVHCGLKAEIRQSVSLTGLAHVLCVSSGRTASQVRRGVSGSSGSPSPHWYFLTRSPVALQEELPVCPRWRQLSQSPTRAEVDTQATAALGFAVLKALCPSEC